MSDFKIAVLGTGSYDAPGGASYYTFTAWVIGEKLPNIPGRGLWVVGDAIIPDISTIIEAIPNALLQGEFVGNFQAPVDLSLNSIKVIGGYIDASSGTFLCAQLNIIYCTVSPDIVSVIPDIEGFPDSFSPEIFESPYPWRGAYEIFLPRRETGYRTVPFVVRNIPYTGEWYTAFTCGLLWLYNGLIEGNPDCFLYKLDEYYTPWQNYPWGEGYKGYEWDLPRVGYPGEFEAYGGVRCVYQANTNVGFYQHQALFWGDEAAYVVPKPEEPGIVGHRFTWRFRPGGNGKRPEIYGLRLRPFLRSNLNNLNFWEVSPGDRWQATPEEDYTLQ